MKVEVDARVRVPSFELDVRFVAQRGITVVFGPTAAGKTLTLRLVAGLERAASGMVRIDEVTVDDGNTHVDPSERGSGYAPQHGALWPHKSALQHVTALTTDARARELLARVGLEKLGERKPRHLSGGERQRLAFARALARSPKLLLLDEPFSALHEDARVAMGEIVREYAARGTVVLFVTHDRVEAKRLADAFVVCGDGHARTASLTEGSTL